MPIYVYEVILDDGDEGQVFEVVQKMSEPALTRHPVTGQPVRRIIQPPNLPSKHTSSQEKKLLSDENIARSGFARFEKTATGEYVKTAGTGPDKISAGPSDD